MEHELEEIVEKILSDNAINSEKALSSYLKNNEEVVIKIKEAATSSKWMHFIERSQDGWYCIQRSSNPLKLMFFIKSEGLSLGGLTHLKLNLKRLLR